jgi:hypothetical protein
MAGGVPRVNTTGAAKSLPPEDLDRQLDSLDRAVDRATDAFFAAGGDSVSAHATLVRVLDDVTALFDRLGDEQKARASFIRFNAYNGVGRGEVACIAIQEAIRLSRDATALARYRQRATRCE